MISYMCKCNVVTVFIKYVIKQVRLQTFFQAST